MIIIILYRDNEIIIIIKKWLRVKKEQELEVKK